MAKKSSAPKTPMTQKDASRIQSTTDRNGGDADFKARAAAAAQRNTNKN